MDAGEAIKTFEDKVIEAINDSNLHPVVVRLVLMNILNLVEKQEQTVAKALEEAETIRMAEKEATDAQGHNPDTDPDA